MPSSSTANPRWQKLDYTIALAYRDYLLIIRIALLLFLAALPVFVAVEVLVRLAMPVLSNALTALGSAMLLSAFTLLISAGLWGLAKIIVNSALAYFSAKQRAQRRLWFVQARREKVKRLFYFKTVQINSINELARKRLLQRNTRKHIRSLAKAIDKDLRAIKTQLTETRYRQLQQDNVRYRNQQNVEALLQLQQTISSLINA